MRIGEGLHNKILVGSNYFFRTYKGFSSKDNDYIVLVDEPLMFKNVLNIRSNTMDVFYWRKMSKDEFIKKTVDPIQVGKFLIPEFCREIGFTISDLKKMTDKFEQLDNEHKYEKIIFEAYIENNDFILTDTQLKSAYNLYLKYRQ